MGCGSSTQQSTVTTDQKRQRSPSIAILQKLSEERGTCQTQAANQRDVDDIKRVASPTPKPRQRRLSSVIGEFSQHVEDFFNSQRNNDSSNDGDALRKIFDTLDLDGTQHVSLLNLKEGFSRLGYASTDESLEMMFKAADSKKDGLLDWNEFQRFFKHMPSIDEVQAEDADEVEALSASRRVYRAESRSTCLIKSYIVDSIGSMPGRVKALSVSCGSPVFAGCDRDDTNVHIFSVESGLEVRTLRGHSNSMLAVEFSPDRKVIASASRDNSLILWDSTVGHQLNVVQHPGVVTCCAFSCDGRFVFTGCQDNLVRKYSVHKLNLVCVMQRFPEPDRAGVVVSLAAQPSSNGLLAMSRSCDKCAYVISSESLDPLILLEGHLSMIWKCSFNNEGTLVVTNCERCVKVWNVISGDCVATFDSEMSAGINGAVLNSRPKLWTTSAFCPSQFGQVVMMFNTDTNVIFVRLDTEQVVLVLNFRSTIYCAAVGLESPVVICGDDLGNVYKVTLS